MTQQDSARDTVLTSATQDQWCEVAQLLRGEIAKMAPNVSALSMAELRELVTAVDLAMNFEIKAVAYDDAVVERKAMLERLTQYGG